MQIVFETYQRRTSGGKQSSEDLLKKQPGCYQIFHRDGVYVGSSVNLANRISSNLWHVENNRHKNRNLQTAYNAHPEVFVQFCKTDTEAEARELEQVMVDHYRENSPERLFNIAVDNVLLTRVGVAMTPEHLEALRQSNINRVVSAETRAKMRERQLGKDVPDSTRRNLSAALKAYNQTPEGKAKKAAATAKLGRKLIADGVEYPSAGHASRVLGVDPMTVKYRANSHLPQWSNYYYLEEKK